MQSDAILSHMAFAALLLHQMVDGREVSCGTCTLMHFFHIRRLCLLCVYFLVLLCSCCREALLEDLHVVVVVREVPSVVLLATAPMRLATAPF